MSEVIYKNSVSVVVPTHNRPDGLYNSLRSLLGQTCLPKEVIVVDDGSVPAVAKEVFKGFPETVECILLRNEVPKGGNNARNQGIRASTGAFISFLDDDDKFKENKIEVLVESMKLNPAADILYHPAHIHMPNEGVSYYSRPYRFNPDDNVFRKLLVQNCVGGTPMVTVRREALLDVGLFDEEMPALQDYELWLRLARKGYAFLLINEPLTDYYHITKRGSVSKSLNFNSRAISLLERKYAEEYSTLSAEELKSYNIWKKKKMIHKSLLNGRSGQAIKNQWGLFVYSPSLVNFFTVLAMLLGPKTVFKLKARLRKLPRQVDKG